MGLRVLEVSRTIPWVSRDGAAAFLFTAGLAASTLDQIAQATTQVQNTTGPIAMIGGFDDQLWGSCDLSQYSVDSLVSEFEVTGAQKRGARSRLLKD